MQKIRQMGNKIIFSNLVNSQTYKGGVDYTRLMSLGYLEGGTSIKKLPADS